VWSLSTIGRGVLPGATSIHHDGASYPGTPISASGGTSGMAPTRSFVVTPSMALVTGDLMNKQVAGKIGISERTVKIHRGNVMRKMRTKSLADLVMIAENLGIRGKENQES
jgi:hypothetical protein